MLSWSIARIYLTVWILYSYLLRTPKKSHASIPSEDSIIDI